MRKIETKKIKKINKKTLVATVDIGKAMMMGYWRCPDGTESKPFEFFNNGCGFAKFWKRISQAKKAHSLEKVIVGFESTGPYGEPLIHYFRKKGVQLVQVNPMHTKKVKELQGNSPCKTDQKDPKVIADIIVLGHALTLVIPEGAAAELRRLTQARERCIRGRVSLLNQLQNIVYPIFPEFSQIMNGIGSKSAQYILKHCPTPQEVIEYGLDPLIESLRKVSRGKFGKERAEALYKAAWQSVGIREGQQSIHSEIAYILSMVEKTNRFISEVQEQMRCYLGQIPYSQSILSLKGVGEITVAGLIGEAGDFTQFKTIPEITKLAGLDLFEISSGKRKGIRRISKRGRSLMRKILYFGALNVSRKGGILHERYQAYLKNGMPKMKALIAIARKLLAIIFALVRDHSNFDEEYIHNPLLLKKAA